MKSGSYEYLKIDDLNVSIEFVSLEELDSPTVVRGMEGEKEMNW